MKAETKPIETLILKAGFAQGKKMDFKMRNMWLPLKFLGFFNVCYV